MPKVLLLVVFAAAAVPAVGQTPSPTPSVSIFMDFDRKPGEVPLAVMEEEASKLLKASGVSLDWRLIQQNRGKATFRDLVVLKFRGKCSVDAFARPASDFGSIGEVHALGVTKVDHGHVLPYTEVECDQVRRALAYLRPGAGSRERQNALGLALGRVVAHELYHILARTTAHAAQGLAKATQSLEELISGSPIGFGDDVAQTIRGAFQ